MFRVRDERLDKYMFFTCPQAAAVAGSGVGGQSEHSYQLFVEASSKQAGGGSSDVQDAAGTDHTQMFSQIQRRNSTEKHDIKSTKVRKVFNFSKQ